MGTKDKEKRRKQNLRYYEKNKEKWTKYRKKQRKESKEFVHKARSGGCERCDENHPACLDFHHRNPDEKEFSLRDVHSQKYSLERIQKEIDKCEVLCSNCHRKEHWKE